MATSADAIVRLEADDASAAVALHGAEPVSWRVGGRELIWSGDPAHWGRHAPILFPVVGASAGGVIRVGGQTYRMPQHGFARDSRFALIERERDAARLRLMESDETWKHFPFRFVLDVTVTLRPDSLVLVFEVTNTDTSDVPYALGFHPAFPWPFDAPDRAGHAVEFEREEDAQVPSLTDDGLLAPPGRRLPLQGRRLALDPELFTGALVFLDARSRSVRFRSPSHAAIGLEVEDFPHLALWTKPTAPFLSMEAWTGHADLEGFSGEVFERASMRRLPSGHVARHALTLRWHSTE
jgi:galactose mutarotase-like enzyme